MRRRAERKARLFARLRGASIVESSRLALGDIAEPDFKHRAEHGAHLGGLFRDGGRGCAATAEPSGFPVFERGLDRAGAQVRPQPGGETVCRLFGVDGIALAPASGVDLDDSPLFILQRRPEDSGRFSSSHGGSSIARRLAVVGRVQRCRLGGWQSRGTDRRQELAIVAPGRAHGLLACAVLVAEQTAADHGVTARIGHRWRVGASRYAGRLVLS